MYVCTRADFLFFAVLWQVHWSGFVYVCISAEWSGFTYACTVMSPVSGLQGFLTFYRLGKTYFTPTFINRQIWSFMRLIKNKTILAIDTNHTQKKKKKSGEFRSWCVVPTFSFLSPQIGNIKNVSIKSTG